MKFYFDPMEFPFDDNFNQSSGTWVKLSSILFREAAQNGYHLLVNGMNTPFVLFLFCKRLKICHPGNKTHDPAEYRSSLIKCEPAVEAPVLSKTCVVLVLLDRLGWNGSCPE
jgi:hypothetical protein